MFSEYGTQCHRVLQTTPYRVLTFNYDRLFELAFCQHFQADSSLDLYGIGLLNTGLCLLPGQQPLDVDLNRFSLLKLHGSVDLYFFEEGFSRYVYRAPDPAMPLSIHDEDFFMPPGSGPYADKPKPALIVFPHEKGFLQEYPDNMLSFRFYIPKIWEAARHFAAQADEIRIVGYSCPEPDFPALRSLLEAADDGTPIVVQDPAADIICRRLRRDLPDQADCIKPCELTFEDG